MKTIKRLCALAAISGLGATQSVLAIDLVLNGGFETGTSANWVVTGSQTSISGIAHTGDWSFVFGTFPDVGTLTQTLPTLAGTKYDISFWLLNRSTNGVVNTPNNFSASFGGTSLISLVNSATFEYTKYGYLGVTGSTVSPALQFSFQDQPGYWAIDDISVTPAQAGAPGAPSVPDGGSTAALLGLGVLGVGSLARFTRKNCGSRVSHGARTHTGSDASPARIQPCG